MTVSAKIVTLLNKYNKIILSIVLKGLSGVSAIVLAIIIARTLSVDDAGVVYALLSVIALLGGVVRVGWDNALVRFVASSSVHGNYQDIANVHIFSLATLHIVFIPGLYVAKLVFENIGDSQFSKLITGDLLYLVAACVYLSSLSRLNAGFLQGRMRIGAAVLFQELWFNCCAVAILFSFYLYRFDNAPLAILFAHLSSAIASSLVAYLAEGKNIYRSAKIVYVGWARYIPSLINFSILKFSSLALMQLPIIYLASMASPEEVASFGVASRISMAQSFLLLAILTPLLPMFSKLSTEKRDKELVITSVQVTGFLFIVAIAVLAAIIVYGESILGLFGPEYHVAVNILLILAVGEFVNMSFGPVGSILSMTGSEKLERTCSVAATCILIILLVCLVPLFSAMGAAISYAVSLILRNLLCAYYVVKKYRYIVL